MVKMAEIVPCGIYRRSAMFLAMYLPLLVIFLCVFCHFKGYCDAILFF